MTDALELEQDRRIASQLPRAFPAFFGRFGRLRNVQRDVVPAVLAGKNVLVCAATASGKTEAACAPLVERYMGRYQKWTVLYISPTRALVNDLYERLCPPLESLGLKVSRRTGDYKDPDTSPHFLLTTPESFDSLLCRGRDENVGHALASTCAVVLDEVHLLYGSARGEQVRWLLRRLQRLRAYAKEQGWSRSADIQIVGLSATVPDPTAVQHAFLPTGDIVVVGGGREIEDLRDEIGFLPTEEAVPKYLASRDRPEKVLVFANARKSVDVLATTLRQALKPYGYTVLGHHGSLSRKERELAENTVKRERAVVLVSTSTLEIGVDIGDIDVVVLDEPPPDISALLQRIGRGNRRTGKTRILTCGDSKRDRLLHDAMVSAARAGWLGIPESTSNLAVARQQIGSFIFQSPNTKRTVSNVVDMAADCVSPDVAAAIVEQMIATKDLQRDGEWIRLDGDLRDATAQGAIHSTIEGTIGHTVIDYDSGDAIAQGIKFKRGKQLQIAGSNLEVKKVNEKTVEAKRKKDGSGPDAEWSYHTGKRLNSSSTTQAVRRYLQIPENVWPSLAQNGNTMVFHFGGARMRILLEMLRTKAPPASVLKVSEWALAFSGKVGERPLWLTDTSAAMLDVRIAQDFATLEAQLARPRANSSLPPSVRIDEVRHLLEVDRKLAEIRNCEFRAATSAEAEMLAELLK